MANVRPRTQTQGLVWSGVLAAAGRAGGRAFVLGCGGHLIFRFVLHHFVPVLVSALRQKYRRLSALSASPSAAVGDNDTSTSSVPCPEEDEINLTTELRKESEDGEETEETDGPTPPPACVAGERPETQRRLWWLWDSAQNLDSLRLGSFLGAMTGGFRVVEFALLRLRGKDDGWNSFLAGSIAGLAIGIDAKARQKAVSLYVFFKACGMVWSSLTSRGLLPQGGGRWTLAQHGIWCLLCGVMMYCFFCEGELLDSFVYRFLYSCTSHHDQYAMSFVRKHALGMADEDPEAKAQERLDYASGKLRSIPPPVVVKRREYFAAVAPSAVEDDAEDHQGTTRRSRPSERSE